MAVFHSRHVQVPPRAKLIWPILNLARNQSGGRSILSGGATDMSQHKSLRLSANFTRLAESDIEAFSDLPVGWISDALNRNAALPHSIRPVTRRTMFAGSALTIETRYNDNLAIYAGLSIAKPGDVLVIAVDAEDTTTPSCSICGDILAGFARNTGISALVTNGLVRDRVGLDNMGIPVFAAGLSPNAPRKDGPGSCGLPIQIADKVIYSGDLICGDDDGVVHIPQDKIDSVRKGLCAIAEKEQHMEQALAAGQKTPDWLAERLANADVEWLK